MLPQKCVGCELCVAESQRQLNKLGLEGAFIRIFRDGTSFSIVLDPQVNTLDVEKIKSICPAFVFETLESESYELLE
ncbi:MAG TPA: hypothetical protein ENN92_01175 [candidate division WWE3 bacterium]|uniref:Uncharacterized protein n=1 Tax=candidate division WWE3 bacterium TaxID=2053526 RepID=A0A7C1DJ05_UNCKA|nr:hypothetical protein [candidate division WWE3 bacterium]